MEDIVNPHDKLFRETWSDLTTARTFLRQYLPKEVLAKAETRLRMYRLKN